MRVRRNHLFLALTGHRSTAAVLLAMASFFSRAALTGRVAHCVAPRYLWLAPLGIVCLAALGLARLATGGGHHHHHHHPGDGHDRICSHDSGTDPPAWRRLVGHALLLCPLVLAAWVDPTGLSPEGRRKRAVPAGRGAAATPCQQTISWAFATGKPSNEGDVEENTGVAQDLTELTLRDIHERLSNGTADELAGGRVSLVGQVDVPGADAAQFGIMRMLVICCIADAITVGIDVLPLPGTKVTTGQWVRVDGILEHDRTGAPLILRAASVDRVPEPAYPYL